MHNSSSPCQWSERAMPDELQQALLRVPYANWSLIYMAPFGMLDAMIARYLAALDPDLAAAERLAVANGSTCYTLCHALAGPLGEIYLYELAEDRTELYVEIPPRPPKRAPTEQERAFVRAQADREARALAIRAINQQRQADQEAHYRWRRALQAVILLRFFARFEQERLAAAQGGVPARGQGGRPRKLSNTWAYQQVHELGRDQRRVFREWLDMEDNAQLADPHDSFKKAIRLRKGK